VSKSELYFPSLSGLIWCLAVLCPLPVLDVLPDIYVEFLSSDVSCDNMPSSSSRPMSPDFQSSRPSGHATLHDMFLSRRVTGIRASVFHCTESHLQKVCMLHGLDVGTSLTLRNLKLRFLYHIINGDCFLQRCEQSHPSPDRSACLCVAGGFSSAMSITSFVVDLLKNSTPSQVTTEDLLLIVESTGYQSPYERSSRLRRRVLASLDAFLVRCRQRMQRDVFNRINDPFGDLFMGFETKRRPILESIMNHHGLLISEQHRVSCDDMRNAIMTHIALGRCIAPKSNPRPWMPQKTQTTSPSLNGAVDSMQDGNCDDFAHDADLEYEDPVGNEIKIINKILEKSPSRALLLRFMKCKDIPHDALQSRKHLRTTLTKFGRLLEKRRVKYSASDSLGSGKDWPSAVPTTLKDKIAENFRKEISHEQLRSFVCSSCSSSIFVEQRVTCTKSGLDLSCLQHPEMRLSGIPPDLRHISNTNLDTRSVMEGILLDRRGMKDDTLSFCKDCYSYIHRAKTPPLSLANHLLLGDVPPELRDLTIVEESVIARCRAKACIIQLKDNDSDVMLPNTQRGMRGHE